MKEKESEMVSNVQRHDKKKVNTTHACEFSSARKDVIGTAGKI